MTDMENGVLAVVRRFGGKQQAVMDSELYHDLHIYGDDANELLKAINETYGTMFEDFNFGAYFPNETEALPRIVKWLGFKDKTVGSFTITHLVRCVEAGHWFEPT